MTVIEIRYKYSLMTYVVHIMFSTTSNSNPIVPAAIILLSNE